MVGLVAPRGWDCGSDGKIQPSLKPKGIVISDAEMDSIRIVRAKCHGKWNYIIKPYHASDEAVDS